MPYTLRNNVTIVKRGNALVTVSDVITNVAQHFNLDPVLCLADAWHESNLNPKAEGDNFGNGPTSFGLYQLHEGGELGTLTPAEAMNPATNAKVALAQFAAVRAATGLDGGALAAAAQRPADPENYAVAVNLTVAQIKAGVPPAGYFPAALAPAGVPLPYPPPQPPLPAPKGTPTAAQLKAVHLVIMENVGQAEAAQDNGWALWYYAEGHKPPFVAQINGKPVGTTLYANADWKERRP